MNAMPTRELVMLMLVPAYLALTSGLVLGAVRRLGLAQFLWGCL